MNNYTFILSIDSQWSILPKIHVINWLPTAYNKALNDIPSKTIISNAILLDNCMVIISSVFANTRLILQTEAMEIWQRHYWESTQEF